MRHFRPLHWLMMVFAGIAFSSCFDILEEYEFNADGSGKARYVIDMTKMKAMMESLSSMDSTGEASQSFDDMFLENKAVSALSSIPGISNVQNLNNKETGTVGYSYEFANLEALNNALGAGDAMDLDEMGLDMGGEAENYFEHSGKKFIRVFKIPESDGEEAEDPQAEQMAQMMFAESNYTVRYSFASDVKKVKKNDAAVIGPDGRSVTVSQNLYELVQGKKSLSSEILLKSK